MDAILAWVKSMTKEQFEQAGLKASVEVVMFFGFLLVSVYKIFMKSLHVNQ